MKKLNRSVEVFRLDQSSNQIIPVLPAKVKAGGYGSFESPSRDYPEDSIDLLKLLIKDKETVFFARVSGDSLNGIGVFDGDLQIIQKGMFPKENDIVIVYLHGEFYTKKFKPKYAKNSELQSIRLKSENELYQDIYIDEDSDFELWGVVTWNLHKLR